MLEVDLVRILFRMHFCRKVLKNNRHNANIYIYIIYIYIYIDGTLHKYITRVVMMMMMIDMTIL